MCGSVQISGNRKLLQPGMLLQVLLQEKQQRYELPVSSHRFARLESGWATNQNNILLFAPEIDAFWENGIRFSLIPGTMLMAVQHRALSIPYDPNAERVVSLLTVGPEMVHQVVTDPIELEWYEEVFQVHHRSPVYGVAA